MPKKVTIYHVSGKEVTCFSPTATETVRGYPNEWSFKPWPTPKAEQAAPTQTVEAGNAGADAGGAAAVQPPAPPAPPAKVDVPSNWEELTFFAQQEIAQQILGKQDRSLKKEQVQQIIRDYLAAQ